jgi:hypothetical protein
VGSVPQHNHEHEHDPQVGHPPAPELAVQAMRCSPLQRPPPIVKNEGSVTTSGHHNLDQGWPPGGLSYTDSCAMKVYASIMPKWGAV